MCSPRHPRLSPAAARRVPYLSHDSQGRIYWISQGHLYRLEQPSVLPQDTDTTKSSICHFDTAACAALAAELRASDSEADQSLAELLTKCNAIPPPPPAGAATPGKRDQRAGSEEATAPTPAAAFVGGQAIIVADEAIGCIREGELQRRLEGGGGGAAAGGEEEAEEAEESPEVKKSAKSAAKSGKKGGRKSARGSASPAEAEQPPAAAAAREGSQPPQNGGDVEMADAAAAGAAEGAEGGAGGAEGGDAAMTEATTTPGGSFLASLRKKERPTGPLSGVDWPGQEARRALAPTHFPRFIPQKPLLRNP